MSLIAIVRPYSSSPRPSKQRAPRSRLARFAPVGALLGLLAGSGCAGDNSAWDESMAALDAEEPSLGAMEQALAVPLPAVELKNEAHQRAVLEKAAPVRVDALKKQLFGTVDAEARADESVTRAAAQRELAKLAGPASERAAPPSGEPKPRQAFSRASGGQGPSDPICEECAFYLRAGEVDARVAVLFKGDIFGASLFVLGGDPRDPVKLQNLEYLNTLPRGAGQVHYFSTAGSIAATGLNPQVAGLLVEGVRTAQGESLAEGEGEETDSFATLLEVIDGPLPPVIGAPRFRPFATFPTIDKDDSANPAGAFIVAQ